MDRISSCSIVALCFVAAVASAAPVTLLQQELTFDVNADATFVVDELRRVRINDDQGAKGAGNASLLFSDSLDKLDVVEAFTTTVDGKRLDVTADKVFIQQLPPAAGAPSFSDRKIKIVVFPQVEPGSVLTLRTRRTRVQPELPGVFSMRYVEPVTADVLASQITLRVPRDFELQTGGENIAGGEVSARGAATREFRWTLKRQPLQQPEPGSLDIADVSPYVIATNLKSYEQLGKAYLVAAGPAAKVTPAIQELADRIAKDLPSKRAEAEALYRWVGTNVRYVAIFLGTGGYVPHSADEVMNSRYGDCKDHVVLLGALLAARGIVAHPVLVNSVASYKLPAVAALAAFNHVITYIPSLDVYLDTTTGGFSPFGVLASTLYGKSAVLASTQPDKEKIRLITLPAAPENSVTIRRDAQLGADGTLVGTSSVSSRGPLELGHRAVLGNIPKDRIPQIANALLSRAGQSGTSGISFDDPRDLSKPFTYTTDFKVSNYARIPGPGAISTRPGFASPFDIESIAQSLSIQERKLPFLCTNAASTETIALSLPAEATVSNLPAATSVTTRFGTYEATYARAGAVINIRRAVRMTFPTAWCNAADYPELKRLGDVIRADLQAQILIQ